MTCRALLCWTLVLVFAGFYLLPSFELSVGPAASKSLLPPVMIKLRAAMGADAASDGLKAVLYGMCIGDALAMPVHWYYNVQQLKRDFGRITDFEAPKDRFPGSIMNLSNTGGGGRGDDSGSIIGDVILFGKKKFWTKGGEYHYHHGMAAGENTLDLLTARLMVTSLAHTKGVFDKSDYMQRYITFMTTPGTHNDTYAGTCHRIFFANWAKGVPPEQCAGNDGHNVDTIDGLVNLIPLIAAAKARAKARGDGEVNRKRLREDLSSAISVIRRSDVILPYAEVYADMLLGLNEGGADELRLVVERAGQSLNIDVVEMVRSARGQDPMTACYLGSAFPTLLHYAYKYADDPKEALLAQTNAGGENVARGALLGSLMAAAHGLSVFPPAWITGLQQREAIETDAQALIAVLSDGETQPRPP